MRDPICHIPEDFARTVRGAFQEAGEDFLRRLPRLLADCVERWSLTIGPPFALSYNYVAPAVRADGSEVVLKVGVPQKELWSEMEALRCYDGQGMIRLLDADSDLGALLLERLKPGTMLITLFNDGQDAEATSLAAAIMRKLRRPAPMNAVFPTVADWANGMGRLRAHFHGGTGPFPETLVEQAETLFAELLISQEPPVLLHGDLHHYNILSSKASWVAIDPKGILGEPAYEVGAFLRNPLPQLLNLPNSHAFLSRRIDQFSDELNLERARVRGWALAQAVLSAWWSFEDNDDGQPAIAFAELLSTL